MNRELMRHEWYSAKDHSFGYSITQSEDKLKFCYMDEIIWTGPVYFEITVPVDVGNAEFHETILCQRKDYHEMQVCSSEIYIPNYGAIHFYSDQHKNQNIETQHPPRILFSETKILPYLHEKTEVLICIQTPSVAYLLDILDKYPNIKHIGIKKYELDKYNIQKLRSRYEEALPNVNIHLLLPDR